MWGIVSKWQNPFRSEHFPRSSRGKPTHFWGSRMKRPRMRKAAVSHYLWVGKVAGGASCRCEYWICSRCPLWSIDTAVTRCCERRHFKGVVEDQACVWCFQIYLGWWFPSHIAPKKMLYNCSRGSSAAKWCKTSAINTRIYRSKLECHCTGTVSISSIGCPISCFKLCKLTRSSSSKISDHFWSTSQHCYAASVCCRWHALLEDVPDNGLELGRLKTEGVN